MFLNFNSIDESLHAKGWSLSKGKCKEKKTRNLSNDYTE